MLLNVNRLIISSTNILDCSHLPLSIGVDRSFGTPIENVRWTYVTTSFVIIWHVGIPAERKKKLWRSRDLNPGLSACEADTLPLSYTPLILPHTYDQRIYVRVRKEELSRTQPPNSLQALQANMPRLPACVLNCFP